MYTVDEELGWRTLGIGVTWAISGVQEFTNSHEFVEKVGQPFWHDATSYFQKIWMECHWENYEISF